MLNDLKLIKNEEIYWEFIRKLRTDKRLASGFAQQVEITQEQQKDYMQKYGQGYYICLKNSQPVGFIGVVDKDLRLATSFEHQRMGIANFMLEEFCKLGIDFEVKVKQDNEKSLNLFLKKGFKIDRENGEFFFLSCRKNT